MKRFFYPLCAVFGASLAAGVAYLTTDRTAQGMPFGAPAIMIAGVQGAPGDGNTSLQAALQTIMTNAKIPLTDQLDGCVVAVTAEVSTLTKGQTDEISIIWQVSAADGQVLGDVAQVNLVPAGSLDGAWGTDASLAARGARDGIVKIMLRPRPGCPRT